MLNAVINRKVWALGFVLALLTSPYASSEPVEISAGDLIKQVIAGKDFTGQELVVSGVAVDRTSPSGLLNIASVEDYRARRSQDNFISVYETTESVAAGSTIKVRVLVETSMASKIGGSTYVLIESTYQGCLSCK